MKDEIAQKIVFSLRKYNIDAEDVKTNINIILNEYEVTKRCTEIAILDTDRNMELLRKFIIGKTVRGCTKKTIDFYKNTIVAFLNSVNKTIDEITPDDIRYYMALRERRDGVSKVTVDNERRNLNSFFGYLHAEEVIRKNPMARIERVKYKKKKKKAFSEMDIEKMRGACKDAREQCMVEVMLSTGCRVTELVLMKIEEIESDQVIVHGKGEKDRTVYLNAKAQLAIENYLKDEKRKDSPYLFPGYKEPFETNGKRDWSSHLGAGSVESAMRELGKRAGVKECYPHRFRRTCATMAMRRGMPLITVSKMLGHESVETTQIYIDIGEEELQQQHKRYVI